MQKNVHLCEIHYVHVLNFKFYILVCILFLFLVIYDKVYTKMSSINRVLPNIDICIATPHKIRISRALVI